MKTQDFLIGTVAEDFSLDTDDFKVSQSGHLWEYTGPLDDLQDWFKEHFPRSRISTEEKSTVIYTVDEHMVNAPLSNLGPFTVRTVAPSLEAAWRLHFGELLINDEQPYAEFGARGQTLTVVLGHRDTVALELSDGVGPRGFHEQIMAQRWRIRVADGEEFMGFRSWMRSLATRRLNP